MRVIVFLALFAFAYGDYPAATPEIVEPSDSYGPPPEVSAATYSAPAAPSDSYSVPAAPSDSYGAPVSAPLDSYSPPKKVTVVKVAPAVAPVASPTVAAPTVAPIAASPEILAAQEPVIAEAVAPAPSASFSLLSTLAAPALTQQVVSVPVSVPQEYQTSLVPPVHQYQYVQPVQTYSIAPVRIAVQAAPAPPVHIPPVSIPSVNIPPVQNPVPLPPISLPPVPVQPLPLETKTTTQVTTFPRSYYAPQYVLSAPSPISYAPSFTNFYQASPAPTTFLTAPRITSQISSFPEYTSYKYQAVKSAPAIPRIPATTYGAPLEAFSKKK